MTFHGFWYSRPTNSFESSWSFNTMLLFSIWTMSLLAFLLLIIACILAPYILHSPHNDWIDTCPLISSIFRPGRMFHTRFMPDYIKCLLIIWEISLHQNIKLQWLRTDICGLKYGVSLMQEHGLHLKENLLCLHKAFLQNHLGNQIIPAGISLQKLHFVLLLPLKVLSKLALLDITIFLFT